ncbi:TIGR03857 family LLM class F420-dependent oxidoreductase [Acidocella sp.]|uniref:TIGR03857 family LLM class F420-dependent oxidoreductase n=2 Tax=Acidocella sp. TaxID=50710 RepID=UPI00262ED8EC|nr:TIGR03857 family LLM class F420-dependent oxidoreductase [Acidocella sp.]
MTGMLPELGYYTLAGHSSSPRDLVAEVRQAEITGIGATFISERFSTKDAAVVCGALGGLSEQIGIATGVTNHTTRHPLITATMAATMHRLTNGRFALGLGRGFDGLFRRMGLDPVTSAQIEDFAGIMRRLWRGERVVNHDGPAGKFPLLHQDSTFDEHIPIMLAALGPRTMEFAGSCMDGVILHTFFSDEAVQKSVQSIRRGAEKAGRDPDKVRIWSVLSTVPAPLPEEKRLRKTVGRLAAYLRGYGGLLVQANGWDPEVLRRFLADDFVAKYQKALDGFTTLEELQHLSTLIPAEWLAISAAGTPEECARTVAQQFDLGVTGVIMHGATPDELTPVVEAYRRIRPQGWLQAIGTNPGWMP